mgnify:CR=1 FL=1
MINAKTLTGYRALCGCYVEHRNRKPDRCECAVLFLLAARGEALDGTVLVDFVRGEVTSDGDAYRQLSTGEQLLVDLARHLYRERPEVDLWKMLDRLDDAGWGVAQAMMCIMRTGEPGAVPEAAKVGSLPPVCGCGAPAKISFLGRVPVWICANTGCTGCWQVLRPVTADEAPGVMRTYAPDPA